MTAGRPIETFHGTAWAYRRDILSWDLLVALPVAGVSAAFVTDKMLTDGLHELLLGEVTAIAALFGFIVAGLAVVVAFLDERFLQFLAREDQDFVGNFWPFWLVAGLAVISLALSGAGLIIVAGAHARVARYVFGVTTLFALWALFASLRLVQFIVAQGVSRALILTRRD